MRFGYCLNLQFLKGDETSLSIFDAVCESGFDYLELPMFSLMELNSGEFLQLKKKLADKGAVCRATNVFFPQVLPIVGPEKDISKAKDYIDKALALAADLGVETIVFGNGGARRVGEGMSHEGVWSDLRELAEIMDDFAGKNGVNVVIEPLNQKETNMIVSYTEAVKLVEGLKHVCAMCDWYHVQTDRQTLDDLLEYPNMLGHLHIAYGAGRLIPSPDDDMALYDEFIKAVKKLGYNNKLSIEGGFRGTEPTAVEIGKSLEALKKMF